ncbi:MULTISPECIES: ABC transporter permease [Enterococcus]|uniref:ABC transporter permease n=1 Tax=Enterococcus TaxID=1350 RepID=UPI000BF1382F|nr:MULTISPECIES: ABC transporter permease [Enterococcus]MBO0432288.1 ABC transporter permease [Enterococcus sp. DIV0660C]PEH49700.1 teichoic acid transporter permease [Enterococcus faecium]
MKLLFSWLKLQILNIPRILRITHFDKKSINKSYSFGFFWEFLSPTIQILIYYFVFGVRLKGQTMINSQIPYIDWMLIGMIPWFYISSSIVVGSGSIYQNLNLISKTKFPVEILPTISILKGLNSFFTMMGLFLFYFIIQGFYPTLEWIQLIYYFFCMIISLLAISVVTSAITVMFRDLQPLISSSMRLLFFISGTVINVSSNTDSRLAKLLLLNPFVYIIEGFRDALLSRGWFFHNIPKMAYFFSSVALILLVGIYITEKYKNDFVEYM